LSKDEVAADNLFRRAADQENPVGLVGMGHFYEHGLGGLERSIPTAALFYKRAAAQGNTLAIERLRKLDEEAVGESR
jgi:TPR repeat protein